MRSLGTRLSYGTGSIYGMARARTDSSGVPIRTSPLDDEDADLEAPHSASAHSMLDYRPVGYENRQMREATTDPFTGTQFGLGYGNLPGWRLYLPPGVMYGYPTERPQGMAYGRNSMAMSSVAIL